MFRLHIDIPLSDDEALSVGVSKLVIEALVSSLKNKKEVAETTYNDKELMDLLKVLQYRLSKDEDRRVRNYMVKDDNGHAIEKKTRIEM